MPGIVAFGLKVGFPKVMQNIIFEPEMLEFWGQEAKPKAITNKPLSNKLVSMGHELLTKSLHDMLTYILVINLSSIEFFNDFLWLPS